VPGCEICICGCLDSSGAVGAALTGAASADRFGVGAGAAVLGAVATFGAFVGTGCALFLVPTLLGVAAGGAGATFAGAPD
jgi:hypothetical protein